MLLCMSVITKLTVRPSVSRFTLPSSTTPPMRKLRPCGASLLNTWVGVKYRLTLFSSAFSTRPTTKANAATATAINTNLFWRGFISVIFSGFIVAGFVFRLAHQAHLLQGNFPFVYHHRNLNRKNEKCNSVRTKPNIDERVFPHPDIQTAHCCTSDTLLMKPADCSWRCNGVIPAPDASPFPLPPPPPPGG